MCREPPPIKPSTRWAAQKAVIIQDPLSEQRGSQSSERLNQRPSRQRPAPSEPLPSIPTDSQSFDPGEPWQALSHGQFYGHLGGGGGSRTNLQSTLGDRNTSKGDVGGGKDSLESSVRDNDKGRLGRGVRQNDPETSCVSLFLILTYPAADPVTQFSTWMIRQRKGTAPIIQVLISSVRCFISSHEVNTRPELTPPPHQRWRCGRGNHR